MPLQEYEMKQMERQTIALEKIAAILERLEQRVDNLPWFRKAVIARGKNSSTARD